MDKIDDENELKKFINIRKRHPKLDLADEALTRAILHPTANLIFMYGASRVGKTTVKAGVERTIREKMKERMMNDPGFIPLVSLSLMAPCSKGFDWKENYYVPLLTALHDPIILKRKGLIQQNLFCSTTISEKESRKVSELERTAIEALKNRKPLAVLIDEGQHFGKVASGKKLNDQMDYIKSLSDATDIPHVLIGTHEMGIFRNLGDQLNNRSFDIHFERYFADRKKDVADFQDILSTFEEILPIRSEISFTDWEFFYTRTLGCVGALKIWLNRAVNEAWESKNKILTQEHLDRTAKSLDQIEKSAMEITSAEAKLSGDVANLKRIYSLIGIKPVATELPGYVAVSDVKQGVSNDKAKRGRPPGGKARRDKVG